MEIQSYKIISDVEVNGHICITIKGTKGRVYIIWYLKSIGVVYIHLEKPFSKTLCRIEFRGTEDAVNYKVNSNTINLIKSKSLDHFNKIYYETHESYDYFKLIIL